MLRLIIYMYIYIYIADNSRLLWLLGVLTGVTLANAVSAEVIRTTGIWCLSNVFIVEKVT